jgi:hypothetical protein
MNRFVFVSLCLMGCAAPSADPSESTEAPQTVHKAVDYPHKPRRPVHSAAANATMEYFGGPVISNAKVYVVWWGDPKNIDPTLTAAQGASPISSRG